MTTEQNMLDALIQHQVYAHRASTKVVNELNGDFLKASNAFTSKLRDLLDDLTEAERNALVSGVYSTDTLKEVKQTFDDWYQYMFVSMPETFVVSAVALATYEALYISKLYGEEIEISGEKILKQVKKKPIVGGQLYDDIWKTLATNTREKALYAVRQGIEQGLTTQAIVSSIKGTRTKVGDSYEHVGGIVQETQKKSIESAVRTIRNAVSNNAYDEAFTALGYEYRKVVATLDGRTCPICSSRDGDTFKVGSGYPPLPWHFRTRTVAIGCDKDGKIDGKRPFVADTRSVKNIPKEERTDKIGQIDANTTYPQWFAKQPAEFQKEVLGKTKYELYKNGGFTLDKFVDPLNKPYSIAELRDLDQKTFKRLGL